MNVYCYFCGAFLRLIKFEDRHQVNEDEEFCATCGTMYAAVKDQNALLLLCNFISKVRGS